MENTERIFDNSTISCFLECRKKYYWRLYCHLTPKVIAPALSFGLAVHEALDAYYTDGLAKAIEIFRATYADKEGEQIRTVENGIKLLENYAKVYMNEPFKVIGKPEAGFVFPIGDILWGGRIDAIVEWDGELFILEHKTTTVLRGKYFNQFDLSRQVTGYILAAEEYIGRKCMGCVINALEPWKEVIRKSAKTKKDSEHFARYPITRNQAQKDLFKLDVQRIIRDINWCEKEQEFYTNTESCFSYNYDCPYKVLCKYGEDPRFIARDFNVEKWEPFKIKEEKKDDGANKDDGAKDKTKQATDIVHKKIIQGASKSPGDSTEIPS